MLQVPPEPIEAPAHEHIELAPPGVLQQRVERGPAILRAADAVVDIFDRHPLAGRDVASEFKQVVIDWLIDRGNAHVNRATHRRAPEREGAPEGAPSSATRTR